ncbi:MAG: ABC-F type ribosomal protection protein [Erysipelotrichaceae bacterium]|nr:ABC-F type ribosomal protection protein [Erysipelotrichaceae bacterium]
MLLKLKNVAKQFAGEDLFADANLEIKNNEKVAIIGRNGCGKTTLLRLITGEYEPDRGEVIRNGGLTLGYLSQKAFEDENMTVREAFDQMYRSLLDVKQEMDQIALRLESEYDEKLLDRYAALQQYFEMQDGYNYNQQQLTLFTRFGFSLDDLDRPISSFSGGQKTKIGFVKLLLIKPDILLLDEPTNHLDMQTIEWLEGYLKKYPKAIILVSHDRMFIDRVVSEIYEFEFGQLNHYTGNYTSYVEQKKQQFLLQQTAYRHQQLEIKRLEEQIEKFRYKKNKAAFAQSKIKYLERMERIDKPRADQRRLKLHFESSVRGGNQVLTVEDLTIGYDKPLCTVSFQLTNGQRLAIIGPNGLGKSTLVKTLMGQVEALGGDFMYGHQIEVAYFDQQLAQIDSDKTVLEELWDLYPEYDHTAIRKILGSFLFSADDVFKQCSVLSGGEKVRLALCKMMLSHANLLILDEPTNHLDIAGKEALEDALMDYDGTIIFVSHDRYFIKKLAQQILYIEGDRTTLYKLNYEEYLDKIRGIEPIRKAEQPAKAEKPAVDAKTQRENSKKAAALERQIARAEEQLEELRALRFEEEYYHDYQKMNQLNEQIDDKHNEIARLMEQWEQYAD